MVLRIENPEAEVITGNKRKREARPLTDSNYLKHETSQVKKIKSKKVKSTHPDLQTDLNAKSLLDHNVNELATNKESSSIPEDVCKRYPVLVNQDLVQKFLNITMTNNQKGRIRQLLKDSLKGTSEFLLPDVIHNKIQSILKSSTNLSETELRKVRILYNMLKTAVVTEKPAEERHKKKKKKPNKKKDKQEGTDNKNKEDETSQKDIKEEQGDVKKTPKHAEKTTNKVTNEDSKVVKPKGPKRYVVFVGNLPPDITKEQIMQHFSEFNECIVGIRIPKRAEGKKSSIAYVELKNEPTYELALSKHHSMLGSKRINVLYTMQKNGKVTKTEAKSKSAKLIALQKAGKLIGSVPLNRKRSYRRTKMKRAQAKLVAEST